MYMCGAMCDQVFFFKQKTAYEMRISDWSSDVCSSDLPSSDPLVQPAIGEGFIGGPRLAEFDVARALKRIHRAHQHARARLSPHPQQRPQCAERRRTDAAVHRKIGPVEIGRAHV